MNTVIYYPYLQPRSDWLRLAALGWDTVYVLSTAEHDSSTDCSELEGSLPGFVDRSVFAENVVDEEIVESFTEWVIARSKQLKTGLVSQAGQPLFGIHPSKFGISSLGEKTWALLHEHGLAKLKPFRAGELPSEGIEKDQILLPKDVALFYLSLCAGKLASTQRRDLFGDDQVFTNVLFGDPSTLRAKVLMSSLQAYLPARLSDLDPTLLAEFREKFGLQRLKYASAVQSLVDEFSESNSEEDLGLISSRIVSLTKERVEEVQTTFDKAKLEAVTRAVSLSVAPPAILGSLHSILHVGLYEPAGIAATLALFVAATLQGLREVQLVGQKNAWSYALNVKQLGSTKGNYLLD